MTAVVGDSFGPAGGSLVAGEFPFTARDFRRIASLIHGAAGISLPETKVALVYSRLAKRLRVLGLRSFGQYCALVETQQGADERQKMLAALTTNVTRFFREPHHFEHMKQKLLPPLIDRARAGGRVRLWSAGCASGEEAYSMALTLLAAAPDASRLDIKILASDINTEVLETGRLGVYSRGAVAPIDGETLRRWFKPVRLADGGEAWEAGESLAGLIAFRELNLIGDWPMSGRFDAVFCRNVFIYFDDEVQAGIWKRLPRVLNPGACVYIGHSERLADTERRFNPEAMTVYRLAGAQA
ncbi:MAG: protein-glutamate O-methyltransferase [Caulobacteraceae bacterium]